MQRVFSEAIGTSGTVKMKTKGGLVTRLSFTLQAQRLLSELVGTSGDLVIPKNPEEGVCCIDCEYKL